MDAIVHGDYDHRVQGSTRATRSPTWRGPSRCSARTPSTSATPRTPCAPPRSTPRRRCPTSRNTQTSLIEAEKLAALGGLVAGVAHEVNNPVGISLTVASSLERRCQDFAREIEEGPIRRSRLTEFVAGNRDAATQLVSNLHRAGELIQSFKQVAVDRSHAERRSFDLKESLEQVIASLRPGLKKSRSGSSSTCRTASSWTATRDRSGRS
jgi:C4-dicarboxylate-specific signal transduction histidine kinase